MVEISNADEIIQLRKIKTRDDQTKRQWGFKCQCCHRKFLQGGIRFQWRLRTPFRKRYNTTWDQSTLWGWSSMFWTVHCKSCFILTANAWEKALPRVVKLAKS